MARPRRIDRPVEKRISLPRSLVVQVELELFSDLEQKVPFGAWQRLLIDLLERQVEVWRRARAGEADSAAVGPNSTPPPPPEPPQ